MKIGYIRDTYAERRLFIDKVPDYKYISVEAKSADQYADILSKRELDWSVCVNQSADFDLVHLFNSVNYGTAPWIVTFETSVPRLYSNEHYQYAMPALEAENCIAIIAMSEAALNIHNAKIKQLYPDKYELLSKKTFVLHPSQTLMKVEMSKFNHIKPLKVIFVSNQFFLKGGEAIVAALEEFRKIYPVELHIISRFSLSDNVTLHTQEDNERMMDYLKSASWIKYYPGLPNDKVLDLMAECHLGVCLSFAETYGYVVLEMQAAGCPVVTTDIRAFPEINSDEIGYIVHYPYRNGRLPNTATKEDVKHITEELKQQFFNVLESIAKDQGCSLAKKAFMAQYKIFNQHNTRRYGEQLAKIYSAVKK